MPFLFCIAIPILMATYQRPSQAPESMTEKLWSLLTLVPVLQGFDANCADICIAATEDAGSCSLVLQLPHWLKNQEARLSALLNTALASDYSAINIQFEWLEMAPALTAGREPIAGVKHIIAVASGKGGVGKSTTAVNLALALQTLGAKVGMLDADVYGPSQTVMLNIEGARPEMLEGKRMNPVMSPYGIAAIGMGNLVSENTPMAWRGPMATGALQQMLRQTHWSGLDFLIIDMPPGTGDIQLTLAQTVPVSGSVIVTTPQDIALLDAKKGIELFRKVNIDVLGVIENMATHTCTQCGHQEAIFGEAGGALLAEQYHTSVLGRLPLKLAIRHDADSGKPSVAADPNSLESQAYIASAQATVLQLFLNHVVAGDAGGPSITASDD